jgi:peroxiredoxin Q/BCP
MIALLVGTNRPGSNTRKVARHIEEIYATLMKMYLLSALPLLAAVCLTSIALHTARGAETPKVGDSAPPVNGKDQNGKAWKLADVVGKKVVLLYFYPKDDTPGCTKEACGFRDRLADLNKEGVEVIGVSFDSTDSHQKFIAKYKLSFRLLADTDGGIADTYGVRMAGRDMARRVSFLIGLDGKIVHVTDTPNAQTHLTEMTQAVSALKKTPAP